ncbi:hypothetical protein KAM338_23430 [Aeromonas caviae]|uniref:phage tail fiber protein n=1 Tax=Aeromonas hydrophila TaxID=644 RepID=UPI00168090B9|nr:tail fiber domain-containing protein [Aeromonas hydrophila]BCK65729.1 hypothetical protein KAM330_47180 [Aeromonas hydrophila]GKQ62166.1 hypothetical protein KAM338_23430 [Aeromonas caviae]
MTTPTITELYAQIGAMMANWQRFLDQQMGWQAGPSSANDLSPPDNNPANKGYRVMLDAAGNKRQIMTPSQMEKIVADAVKQIDDLNPAALGAQFTQVRANLDEITASLSSSRAELTALVDSATSSKNAAASSATAAASSATAAASSATSASSSKTAAASSATAAAASQGVATTKASESQASAAASANKAADAAVSASTASTKAGEAATSAATASTKAGEAAASATTASTKAGEAAASATAAATSATAAKTSETNANTKASAAASSAVTSQKWADNAVDSAVTTGKFSALHHATKASESAAAAAASANTSLIKASEASGHASSASTSASTATTKAGEAATGASTATAKAAAAASSATSAASSATAAGNSATAAANSATAASNSASSASSSKAAAASSAADAAASAQIAREAMYVSTGALMEAGEVNMSSGVYPTPLTGAADKDLACFWKVTTAGVSSLDGVDYEVGDTLVYSSSLKKFYKIDNTESVQSVNGMKGAVRLTAADVGALGSGATAVAAAKLATARTISITGDGTGSASFDGTGNVSISLAVTDDSHAHTFSNLKNRPTTLAGYGITDAAASDHAHADLFQKAGGVITGLTQVNIASGPTIGGTTFDNGWLRVGTSAGGIAIDSNEIMASGHELLLGSITSHGIGLMIGNVKAGAVKADGLYSMNSKVLTEAAGSAVSAGKLATARALALTGDATGSLTFDGSADASMAVTLADSGVTAGTFTKVTVDAKGRVTAATTQTAADIPALDWSKITSGKPTNLTGYGVSSATLKAIEGLAMAADKAIYFTAAGTAAVMTMTGAARALLDDADSAAMRATLGAASTSAATTTANGLMSAADKAKLDSVQASANAYVHPASGVAAGSYRTVTVDANGHVTGGSNPTTLNDYGITDATPSSHVGSGGTAHASASPTMAGFMSAADKAKLDGIGAGANNYTHPTGDGNLHVPATGTTSNGKVLKAGATAGSFSWASLTPDDVGLSNVNNWPFSTTTNDPSDTTYATAGAVKRAADIANAALPKAGGSLTGSVTFTNDSVLQWSRNSDAAAIGFKNSADSDTDSFMWFRTSDNGNEYFKWQSVNGSTTTDLMTLKSDNLRIKGDQVYHQGFKPTPAEIGAAVAGIFQGEGYKQLGSTHLLVGSEYKYRWYKVCEWDLATSRIDQTYEIDVHGDTNYSGSTGRVRVNVSRYEKDPQGRLHVVVTPVHGNQRAACVYVTFDNNKTVVWVKSARMWGSISAQVIGSPNGISARPKEELTGVFAVDGDAEISGAQRVLCHHTWDGDANVINALPFDGGELFDSGNRVYSASSRPTLRDINGGTFSGIFKTDVDGPIAFVAERAGYRAAMGNSVVAGEYIFGGMASSSSDYQHYIRLGNNKFQYHQDGSNFDVYHTGNKPTATDVGLSNVNNWGATAAVNDASDTKYATAGAVKKAYDLAAAALPSSKADVFKSAGMLTDLNVAAAAKPGFFRYGPGAVGAPMSGYGHGLVVSTGGNPGYDNWYQQIAFGHDAKIYTRRGVNSAATGAWARIYTTEDKPSLAELGAAAADHTHYLRDIKDSPYKEGCDCATTANLSAAYANGDSGVGATLTNSSTLAALAIDGVAVTVGIRVLVKNQTAAAQNGIYTVTKEGSATEAWVLTRTPGCDTSAEAAGAVVTVDQGTANGGLLMTTEFKRNGVIGTTAMNWRVVVDGGNISAQHHNSGATAGTYRSVTVNAQGHVTAGTNPTTLAGYGITDALGINANAVSATKLATARTLTVGGTGKAFDGTANLSWSLAEIGAARARGELASGATENITTAQFVQWLKDSGAFDERVWIARGSWSYANNKTITDTGCGNIHLAGCTIEVISGSEFAFTIRIITPTTTSGGGTTGAEFVYVNNGSAYLPGWRRIYTTAWKPNADDVGALPSGGTAVAATKLATARQINGTNFDGTANITTANWGTARTLTIGNAGKSVNGSEGVTWSLVEIGAVSKAGDAMDGNLDAPKFTSRGVEFFGDGAWAMIKATGKEGVILHVDTAQQARVKVGTNGSVPIYHALNKPSSGDVGLGNVNNWGATAAVNDASDTTYATAGAVKKAYDLAAAALPADSNAVSATKLATARTISATGDATGSADFDGSANAAIALTLANSGVTAGTYGKVTVDAKGRVTAGLAMVAADIPSLDWSKISSGKPTTLAGYGITDAQAKHANLTALAGFTPAADRIPYFTSASAASATPLTAFARSLLDDNDAAAARATLGVLSIEEPFKSAADVATTANLDATYASGSSGVGATLTGNVMAALSLDGVTVTVGMRVLVKNQTAAAQNGIYTLTTAGSTTVAWVLTRATDADTSAKLAGAVITVDQGTVNGSMLLTNDWKKTSTVGTTAMNWRVVIDNGNVGSYHHNSGVTAGTYRSVTVNAQGHVTGGSNPTTLSGYGITDAAPSSHVSSGGGAHATATTAAHGFMSSTDKAKLDSIASNANNYAHPTGDGNLHVPATGTGNNGKVLMAGATAGSLSWQSINADVVGAVPVAGGAMSGALTVNNEIRTTSANSMRMVYGNYGTFWRQDGANMYLMFTNAGDQYGGYNSLRPMYANLANGNVNFGHSVDVNGNLSVNTGSTSWIDMRSSAALQSRSAVVTASASAIVRQEHADRHFILGGLGNSCFGVFMINKSRTANGTDAGAYLSADGTWYCGGNVSANDYQVRSDRRLKSEFTEIKDAWDLWKTLQISEYTKEGAREYGFIAQDFEKDHKPAIAKTMTDDYLNLKPMSVLAIAGKVIQSLQDRVENLESLLKECMKRMEVGDASTS